MIILAANCPKDIKEEIEYYCKLSKVPVMTYKGAAMDLAAVCNKLFAISALSIRETGDSEILHVTERTDGKKIAVVTVNPKDKGIAIGKNGKNAERLRFLAKRYFDIQNVSIT